MANSYQDLSQITTPLANTIVPQVITGATNGTAVKLTKVGANRINAMLQTGAAVALTSLVVKLQTSTDGSTGWVDMLDRDGNVVTFTTVTAGSTTPQIICAQPNIAASTTADPYIYVRAVATLVGTSIAVAVALLGAVKFDGASGFVNTPPTNN